MVRVVGLEPTFTKGLSLRHMPFCYTRMVGLEGFAPSSTVGLSNAHMLFCYKPANWWVTKDSNLDAPKGRAVLQTGEANRIPLSPVAEDSGVPPDLPVKVSLVLAVRPVSVPAIFLNLAEAEWS